MEKSSSWQPANIAVHPAIAVTPEVAAKMINGASNPLLVVGAEILKSKSAQESVTNLAQLGIPLVATAHTLKAFSGLSNVSVMNVVELTNLLNDASWGVNGRQHDLVIFIGIHYYLISQMLSSLKNFSGAKTLSLSKYYNTNAHFSSPSLTDELWEEYLSKVAEKVQRR